MIDHIIKKHVTLRVAVPRKAPEPRVIGNSTGGGRDATDLRQEGDGPRGSEIPLKQDPFLRGVVQWGKEVPSHDEAPPHPFRDEEPRS
jgi:hypothetical protein